jgi:type I restriction enzyme S subunit
MSRGRKSITTEYNSDWQKYYVKNLSAYLQLIINGLSEKNNDECESNYVLFESILSNLRKKKSTIKDQEMLFQIPENWFWAKLSDICEISTGKKDVNQGHSEGIYPFFTCAQEPLRSNSYSFDDDCILLPGNGANVGYVNRYKGKFELYQRTYCLHKINESISVDFLELYLRGFWKNNLGQQFGSGINYLRISNFTNFIIPVPPTEMQTKILSFMKDLENNRLKVEGYYFNSEIENKIISYHKSQIDGAEFSNQINYQLDLIKQLRQAFLREAMQGKLVRSSELRVGSETGHDLLAKIKAEKTKLIKEKKLKAGLASSQTISLINDIKIPSHWVWCKADEIFFITKLAGFEYSKHIKLSEHGEIPVVRAQNVRALNIDKKNLLYIDRQTSELLERCALTKKSLLVTFIGAGIGDVATFEENERWHLAPNVAKMEPFIGCENLLSVKFINYFMMSDLGQKEIFKHVKATAQPSLSMGTIRDIDIPLPPLHEQQQIVAKLEELMAFCDGLEQSIKESQGYNEKLLQQVLREALQG